MIQTTCPNQDAPLSEDPYHEGLVECAHCGCKYHKPCAAVWQSRGCYKCGRPLQLRSAYSRDRGVRERTASEDSVRASEPTGLDLILRILEWAATSSRPSGSRSPTPQISRRGPLDGGISPRRTRRALFVVLAVVCLVLAIKWLAPRLGSNTLSNETESPSKETTSKTQKWHRVVAPPLTALAGTSWQGNVGRAPASIDFFPASIGAVKLAARIRYEGIAENLTVTQNADGTIMLRGMSYTRENGTGSFDLDVFYGRISQDVRQIQGGLQDNSRRKGIWQVRRITPGVNFAGITAQLLSATPGAVTQWYGVVGNWPATLEVAARGPMAEWKARISYRGVTEDLSVYIKEDGSVVLAGTSYQRLTGEGPFLLDAFYGRLSADGQTMWGLRIDAAQSRSQWKFSRMAVGN